MTIKSNLSPWAVMVLMISVNFTGLFSMLCMPPLFSEIITEISLSKAQMGSLMGVSMLAAIVFAPIGGMLSDRIGCRWTVGLGIFLAALAGGMRAVVDTPFMLITCMFCIGVGFNIMMPSIPKIFGLFFPPNRLAFVNGINLAGTGVGGAIATAASASLLSPLLGGWREVMIAVAIVYLLIGVLWIVIYMDPVIETSIQEKKPSMLQNFKRVAKVKDVWLLTILMLFQTLGFLPLTAFLPISLEARGIGHAGELSALVLVTMVIFNIIGGRISDRIGRRKPILIFGTAVTGLCILTFASLSGIPLILMLLISGVGAGAIAPVILTIPLEMKEIGPELAATAIGFILMFQAISGFLSPILTGKLIDMTGSYLIGFVFMGSAVFLGALFAIPMKETAKK